MLRSTQQYLVAIVAQDEDRSRLLYQAKQTKKQNTEEASNSIAAQAGFCPNYRPARKRGRRRVSSSSDTTLRRMPRTSRSYCFNGTHESFLGPDSQIVAAIHLDNNKYSSGVLLHRVMPHTQPPRPPAPAPWCSRHARHLTLSHSFVTRKQVVSTHTW